MSVSKQIEKKKQIKESLAVHDSVYLQYLTIHYIIFIEKKSSNNEVTHTHTKKILILITAPNVQKENFFFIFRVRDMHLLFFRFLFVFVESIHFKLKI